MNNKIALEALKLAGFKNPNAIAEIISYVPNSNAALEMLLGIYTPTQVSLANRFRGHKYSSHREITEIISYDDLGNTVLYKVYEQKTKQVYYLTVEDKKNGVYTEERPSSNYHTWENLPTNGYTERQCSLSIDSFEEGYSKEMSTDEAFAKLEEWENYGVYVEKDPTDMLMDLA